MLRQIKKRLAESGMEEGEARAIALLLMEKVCGMSVAEALMAANDWGLRTQEGEMRKREKLLAMVERVAIGEPVQYVLGEAEFCGLQLHVEQGVLIPRKETEELVEWIVAEWQQGESEHEMNEERKGKVLDVGTGSGCIVIALAARLKGAEIEAWDVSEKALKIANGNAERCGVKVSFRQVDVLKEKVADEAKYRVIVSNPPYICEMEAQEMEANVLEHEPHLALFVPNDDPLLFYRKIATEGWQMLEDNGLIFFEINRRFGKEVVELLKGLGYHEVELRQDMFGNDRMVKAIKRAKIR